jgi:three-Cys-motif partner protein
VRNLEGYELRKNLIGEAKPHTIKKFEIVEKYVDGWARKILGYDKSDGLMFIDCMSNCGIYRDKDGGIVEGTAMRVAKLLNRVGSNYSKNIKVFFNDIEKEKIEILRGQIEKYKLNNINIEYSVKDANEFLKEFNFNNSKNYNFLLFYDPYNASIDWEAIEPFLNVWGEVILNHMVSDPTRAINTVKNKDKINNYEKTYCCDCETLKSIGSNRKEYERLVKNIIKDRTEKQYYLASFPFYIRTNALVYDLIYFSHSMKGFRLFKKVAWQTFGGKSSSKIDHSGVEAGQCSLFDDEKGNNLIDTDGVYTVEDIAKYIYNCYRGKGVINIEEIYTNLDKHPIFPSEGYRTEIKDILKNRYKVKTRKSTIEF